MNDTRDKHRRTAMPEPLSIHITGGLARAVGLIATRHPQCGIEITWREGTPDQEWLVTATDGKTDFPYLVDDETGTNVPLTEDEIARVARGESLMA